MKTFAIDEKSVSGYIVSRFDGPGADSSTISCSAMSLSPKS